MNLRATHHGGRSSAIPSVLGTTTLLWSHFLNPPPRVSSLNMSSFSVVQICIFVRHDYLFFCTSDDISRSTFRSKDIEEQRGFLAS